MKMVREVAAGLVLGLALLAMATPAVPQEYTVQPGDVLDISVLGESELSGATTVSPDGMIVLPLIGQLPVTGLTLSQVTEKITTAAKKFVKEPQVAVSVRQTASHKQFVYILGQVSRPGAYELQNGLTIAELVAVAGGPSPGAALHGGLIMRKSNSIPVDLEQLLVEGDASVNVPLQPGDIVIVPESKDRVVIMGGVAKPGPYPIRPGDRVVDALSEAGGPTPNAVLKEIGIIRQVASKPTVTPVDITKFYKDGSTSQNILLQPGDVVYVPERAGVNWSNVLSTLGGLSYLVLLFK